MRARAAEPRQKHIPACQPCRMKSPKDWFHHKQQLTDSDWLEGWWDSSFLRFLHSSASQRQQQWPQPTQTTAFVMRAHGMCLCDANSHSWWIRLVFFSIVHHEAGRNFCIKLRETGEVKSLAPHNALWASLQFFKECGWVCPLFRSIQKSPREAGERINQFTKRCIEKMSISEKGTRGKEGLSAGKLNSA